MKDVLALKLELEIVFMKHCASNHLLVHKDGASFKTRVTSILLTILYQLIFLKFHQLIHSLSSISLPSLNLLAIIVFEIS